MLTELCQYLRNWFVREIVPGNFKVVNGALTYVDGTVPPLLDGQYFRLIGSIFNDGVHKYGDIETALTDEPAFDGVIWAMAVPPVVAAMADEIAQWREDNAATINSPYQSESFGGYSYSLRGGVNEAGEATGATWQNQFAARLAPWRKI